eukprot:gene17915-biopygen5155
MHESRELTFLGARNLRARWHARWRWDGAWCQRDYGAMWPRLLSPTSRQRTRSPTLNPGVWVPNSWRALASLWRAWPGEPLASLWRALASLWRAFGEPLASLPHRRAFGEGSGGVWRASGEPWRGEPGLTGEPGAHRPAFRAASLGPHVPGRSGTIDAFRTKDSPPHTTR